MSSSTSRIQGSGPRTSRSSFTFQLPPETNLERLHATFLDGVLTVNGPFLRNDGKRTLEIEQPHLVDSNATGS
jgi:hypothetical protein